MLFREAHYFLSQSYFPLHVSCLLPFIFSNISSKDTRFWTPVYTYSTYFPFNLLEICRWYSRIEIESFPEFLTIVAFFSYMVQKFVNVPLSNRDKFIDNSNSIYSNKS